GELVAGVDRHEEALESPSVAAARPADEQGLDVGFEARQDGIRLGQLLPGFEREQGFGGACRARVEGDDPPQAAVAEQEGHPHGDLERIPLRVAEPEPRETEAAVGHRAVAALRGAGTGEQQVAGPACTEQGARLDVHDVRVLGGDRLRTHLAPLAGRRPRRLPDEAPQRADGGASAWPAGWLRHRSHAGTSPSAIWIPASSASNGTGTRWTSGDPTARPARRTSYRRSHDGQARRCPSSRPSAS